jgi:predicted enzyme related to lactoylglutathione lyase
MGQPVVHFEIGCKDKPATEAFYSKLFGWKTTAAGPASMIDTDSKTGIDGHFTTLGHEPHHYTIFYVQVDDVQACIDSAVALGGKMLVPPVAIPGGTFAWIGDPDGNTVGLWKPAQAQ